jgi:inorganic phosphate transporter, PiT family
MATHRGAAARLAELLRMPTPAVAALAPRNRTPDLIRLLIAVGFIVAVTVFTWTTRGQISLTLVVAAAIGAYMAMNIGANDVANNVGPAVGARAMTLTRAIIIAAVFEAAGAIIAGGEVVGTIKSGIIDPSHIEDPMIFVWLMMSALLAAALWLNIATIMGAPVSTTHSIVGGVLGAGIAAAGWGLANWGTVGQIAMSWVVSPLFGGLVAAALLYLIKRSITYQPDLMVAARRMVPVLLGLMAWAFTTYLLLKGVSQLVKVGFVTAMLGGAAGGAAIWWATRGPVARRSPLLGNDKEGVNSLFTVPLMFAAALLSFAHGSNDVANAIGPLAAINDALGGTIATRAAIPLWVMMIGALGLAAGLALYGPRLIKTVGSEITEMDPMRAYCIAMAATVTVIIASQLGLPISTTHVTIGAVFGVGFLREYLKANYDRIIAEIEMHHRDQEVEHEEVEAFLHAFERAPIREKGRMLKQLKKRGKRGESYISKRERKDLRKVYRENLVKRSVVFRVIAAWIITVPVSAVMAAGIFYMIRGAMLGQVAA